MVGLAKAKRAKEEEEERRRRAMRKRSPRMKHRCARISTASCATYFATRAGASSANRLREFISAARCEHCAPQEGELIPEKQQWFAWASAKADRIDPLVQRVDPILDTPELQSPSYWRWPAVSSSA